MTPPEPVERVLHAREELDGPMQQRGAQSSNLAELGLARPGHELAAGLLESQAEVVDAVPVHPGPLALDADKALRRGGPADASRLEQASEAVDDSVEMDVVLPERVVGIDEQGETRRETHGSMRVTILCGPSGRGDVNGPASEA